MSEFFELAKSITGSYAAGVRAQADLTKQQLGFLARDVTPLVRAVKEGFIPDPGTSDLDNEQPIHVCMPLGEYRRAVRLLYELEKLG